MDYWNLYYFHDTPSENESKDSSVDSDQENYLEDTVKIKRQKHRLPKRYFVACKGSEVFEKSTNTFEAPEDFRYLSSELLKVPSYQHKRKDPIADESWFDLRSFDVQGIKLALDILDEFPAYLRLKITYSPYKIQKEMFVDGQFNNEKFLLDFPAWENACMFMKRYTAEYQSLIKKVEKICLTLLLGEVIEKNMTYETIYTDSFENSQWNSIVQRGNLISKAFKSRKLPFKKGNIFQWKVWNDNSWTALEKLRSNEFNDWSFLVFDSGLI
jgi:hypothetical protein